ncbi:hypothetical protein KX927_03005 [Escherichia coli]|uniref:hypothetical protein n=1 Tax=Escherichia coli TaxID=562 RepID=UPI0019340B30|nr:hypothetical protein [Escherichia coli]MBL7390664.1 hypothetical protein [Escherichia coli]UWH33032.1 hypothetical protein KYX58_02370 [Escherichia coli]UWH37696.1 hypothetical protein KX927_03005 [Escherichia coli]
MKIKSMNLRIAIFVGVSVAGLFVSLAGGIEWGTMEAGLMAAGTIFMASAMATNPFI